MTVRSLRPVPVGMPLECEAKFLVKDLATWRKIGRLRQLGSLRWIASAQEQQENFYWDTSDLRLHGAHAALKLRQVGPRAELTFKRELSYLGGVSRRIEVTAPVRSGWRKGKRHHAPLRARELQRVLSDPRANPAVRCARRIVGSRPLREVLALRTLRRKVLFTHGRLALAEAPPRAPARWRKSRRCMELARDEVCVLWGGRVLSTHREVELENRGLPEFLFRQAVAGFRREFSGGIRLSRKSKYELGLGVVRESGQKR